MSRFSAAPPTEANLQPPNVENVQSAPEKQDAEKSGVPPFPTKKRPREEDKSVDNESISFYRRHQPKPKRMNQDKVESVNPYTGVPYSDSYYQILVKRRELPAWEAQEKLAKLVQEHQVIILQGETGSGKTTQVPQFLLDSGFAGNRLIACT